MGDKTRELLKAKRRHGWYLAVMLVLAVLVTVGVGGLFHQPAVAKTYQVTVLTCTAEAPAGPGYAGYFVHTHNEDCFDENETLVCPLPEIKAHVHDETCYTTTSVQTCGLAESDGHQHSEACYTRVRGDLICGKSTKPVLDEAGNVLEEEHVHTDECFAWTEELTCGMEAGEGAHHHNESCFEYVTNLSCDKPEVILHVHSEDCFQKNEDGSIYEDEDGNTFLICGMTEVTEHVHSPECFTTYELDDEAAGNTENTEGEESGLIFLFPEEDEAEEQPAEDHETDPEATDGADAAGSTASTDDTSDSAGSTGETDDTDSSNPDSTDPNAAAENSEAAVGEGPHTVVYTGTRGAEMSGMTVLAEIPEGALDKSAQLVLADADESAARKQILQVVNENAAESEEREIASMLLLDIGFVSGGEPAAVNGLDPIRVTIKAAAIRSMSAPKLFHLSDGTAREVKDVLFDAEAGTAVFTGITFSPFAVVDLTGEDPVEETAEEAVGVSMPAQSFTGETDGVIVSVEAPEGAFPEGTTMVVSPVEMDDDTLSNVTGAVESSGERKLVTAQAVDISFFDAEQNLIEPKLPIKVSMKSALVSESENVALVHLTETATAGPAEAETAEAPVAPTAEVVTDVQVVENPDEHNEIQFESDAFSVYVLVGTETITTNYITADGETYTITVTYGPEAMIPAGATLAVAEIPRDSEEYAAYLAQAQSAVKASAAAGGAEAAAEPAEVPEDSVETPAEAAAPAETDNTAETESTGSTGGTTDRVTVTTARFFDITILDAEGNPVEPAAPVDVKIEYMEPAETAENYQVVHFGEETEVLNPAVSGTDGTASAFDFQASSFSVFGVVGTKIIEVDVLLSDGNLYTVSVTYEEDAHIPSGSSLRVVPFEEGTPEYEYARNSVLADKKARGEWVDLSNFSLAALDISILNPNGEEIEPEASVQVEIRIKELPGVENLNEVAGTLAIQHHVEVEDGVVVETVFGGNTDANFKLETNGTVAAEGITVDPNSVSAEDFMPFDSTSGGFSESWSESNSDESYMVSFEAPVFSTFTVTWSGTSTASNSDVAYLYASANNVRTHNFLNNGTYVYDAFETNNLYYMDSSTNVISGYIFRTQENETATGDLYLVYNHTGNGAGDQNVSEADSTFHIRFNNNNSTYADVTVHYVDSEGNPIRRTKTSDVSYTGGSVDTRNVDGTNSNRTLSNYAGSKNGYTFVGVSAKKPDATPSGPHATIHYVDENGNELTVSNGSISSSTLLNNYAYLIYDIEGGEYEYKEAHIRRYSTNTTIKAYLHWNGTNWQYTTNNSNWSNINDDDDIYVVYKKKVTPTEGGTPTLVKLDEDEKPEAPTVTKGSTVNGDGTNTLSLSVTSHTKPREVLKLADVIVIFDRSGSMKENIDNSTEASTVAGRRMTLLQNAVNSLADDLIGNDSAYIYTDSDGVKHKQIEMSLVSFSTVATNATPFTDDADTFNGWVNNLQPDGGTNWEQALQKANEASVDSGRATFVIFVTDGEPTFRMSRMTDTDNSLYGDLYFPNSNTYHGTFYVSDSVYGKGDRDDYDRDYDAALAQAKAIVGKNKNLYMIGIGPEVENLEQFNTDAGADGYYLATSSDALTSAFEDIKKRIAAMAGYSDFQISDGITDLTQTVQKSTLVNFAEDDFTYSKERLATEEEIGDSTKVPTGAKIVTRENVRYVVWDNWDPASENCAKAKYENGAVIWNMGSSFMPQEGYTYQVRFKVWPSQAAYDLLADLNNGVKSYASLSDAEKAQIKEPTTPGGMYTLKTNSETSYNYKDATIIDGTVTTSGNDLLNPAGKFDEVDPLELTTRPLKVKKQWHYNYTASREPVSSITMELYGVSADGSWSQDFKTITLNAAGNWQADDNYISYGLVTYNEETNGDEKIYETGHDFTLREIDDEAHYYELSAGIFRPMFINGIPTILEKVDVAPTGMSDSVFHYSDGSHHYYKLDGTIYQDTLSDTLLLATNSRRSYMDLNKVVVDESGAEAVDDTEFEYEITFTVPSGIENYDTVEKYIWFSVYDSVARRTLAPSEYTCTGVITPAQENPVFSGPEYANYLVAISGREMTLKIKQGWNVRFLNLPVGTTYSFEETNIPEGYHFVKAEVSGTRWSANMVDGTDLGSSQEMTSLPSNTSGSNSDTKISGTIDFANACYSTTYTNKAPTQHVIILKTSQDGTTPLTGAVFSLYTESGYNTDPKQASKTDLTSGTDGMIDLDRLTAGKYYLVETSAPAGFILLAEPVIITVNGDGVIYTQSGNIQSMSNDGVSFDPTTKTFTLKVTNNAGVALPQTGGTGTSLFTALGGLMTATAGAILSLTEYRRRKQQA